MIFGMAAFYFFCATTEPNPNHGILSYEGLLSVAGESETG